jgi:hypothetical protein
MAHAGETILPTHKSMAGMMASGWQPAPPAVNLRVVNQVLGTVMTPNERKTEIIHTMIEDADNRGAHIQMVEQRTMRG